MKYVSTRKSLELVRVLVENKEIRINRGRRIAGVISKNNTVTNLKKLSADYDDDYYNDTVGKYVKNHLDLILLSNF